MLTNTVDGVYKAGFSIKQEAYQAAVVPVFQSLDRLEKMLTGKDYLVGDVLTEADVRLWVTIVGLMTADHSVLLLMPWLGRFASTPSMSVISSATSVPFGTDTLLSIR